MGNYDNYGQNAQSQQAGYQQPQQQGQYSPVSHGPSMGSYFSNKMAKLGLIILILSIIGLILSFVAPWVFVDSEGLDDKLFGHDFENSDDVKLFDDDINPYWHGTPSMADLGFIFLLILGVIIMIIGMISSNPQYKTPAFSLISGILAAIAIIPCIMLLVVGMRFIGAHIINALNETDVTYAYPAPYIIFIFGLIFFILIFRTVKNQISINKSFTQNPNIYNQGGR